MTPHNASPRLMCALVVLVTSACAPSLLPPPSDEARIVRNTNPWLTPNTPQPALVQRTNPLPTTPQPNPWPDLSKPPTTQQGGGEYDSAIIVGLEEYPFLQNIPGARQNARDWYTFLTHTRNTPPERVILLQDREATRERILEKITQTQNITPKQGTIWFIYIGHGAPPTLQAPSGSLALIDAQPDAANIQQRGLARQDLLRALHATQHPSIAILDACFTGNTPTGGNFFAGLQPLVPTAALSAPRTTLLTATSTHEFAGPLPGSHRPAFSYLILGALHGWGDLNKDQRVTAREAISYTRSALMVLLRTRTQTPQLFSADLDRTLSRNAHAPPLDLPTLLHKTRPTQK